MAEPIQGQRWDLSAEEIASKTEDLIKETQDVYDTVAKVNVEDANFANTIKPIVDSDCLFDGVR